VATAIAFLTESRIDRSEVRQNVFMPATWMYAFSIRLTPTPLESGDGVHFMDDVEFIAFDLETTGLHSTFCQIVEIGAVRFRVDGTEVGRMEQLVDPGCPVPERAVAVHGITDDMLLGQPRIEDVLPEFLQFLGSSNTILMAHNASFDIGFLSIAMSRCETALPASPVLDTLKLSRWRLARLRNHRLETVARHLRISDSTVHRALGDALVVQSAFLKLLSQPPAITRIDDLFSFAPPLFFEPMTANNPVVPARYKPLIKAIEISRSISIVYDGGTKGRRRRQITPASLIESRGSLYLIAHCHIDDMEKHFRLDRILEIEGT
jgi:DNA polymerase III epsilon subunit family exonuclease